MKKSFSRKKSLVQSRDSKELYITNPLSLLRDRWRPLLAKRTFIAASFFSLLLLLIAGLIMGRTGAYVESLNSPSLTDTIHNILPLQDFNTLATVGHLMALALIIFYLLYLNPKQIPYATLLFALLVLLRSITLSTTHLGPPLLRLDDVPVGEFFSGYYYTKDLFFSGHVGSTFLSFLIIKSPKYFKYLFLVFPLLMAYAVLAMHVHYTIDIIGGFLFAYAVYAFGEKYLKKKIEQITNIEAED